MRREEIVVSLGLAYLTIGTERISTVWGSKVTTGSEKSSGNYHAVIIYYTPVLLLEHSTKSHRPTQTHT